MNEQSAFAESLTLIRLPSRMDMSILVLEYTVPTRMRIFLSESLTCPQNADWNGDVHSCPRFGVHKTTMSIIRGADA